MWGVVRHILPVILILGAILGSLSLSPSSVADEAKDKARLSEADISELQLGAVVSRIWRDPSQDGNVFDAFAAVDITASAADIWAVMTDCAKSIEVMKDMKSCTVLSGNAAQGSDIREQVFRTPFPFPQFRTIFKTDYILHQKIKVQKSGGDMKVQDALWVITPIGGGKHRVTYKARIGLNLLVPNFMIKRAVRKDTPELMTALRDVAETIQDAPQARPQVTHETLSDLSTSKN
ncbi:MAG: SRPBCC family protein [Maricaulaceae bacterium]